MRTEYATLASLQDRLGQEIGVSGWVEVDQARIDLFAQATGDHQWIHVDPERAARGPYGTTIAHGFLTLSMLPQLLHDAIAIGDVRMSVNYGLNKVRFTAPVPAGSRIRARLTLNAFEPLDGGAQLLLGVAIEREGHPKPVCVAESITRRFTREPS